MFSQLLMQQIDVNVNDSALWVQIILAVGTWALVGISAHYMKKSANQVAESNKINREANDLAKLELKMRLRPEIEFIKADCRLSSGSTEMAVFGVMKNTGTVPASDIRAIHAETSKYFLRDLVWQMEREAVFTKSLSFTALPPGSEKPFDFHMDWNNKKESSILAVWLQYDYEGVAKEKGEKLIVCHVSGGGTIKLEQFLGPEILEMRKRVKKAEFQTDL